MSVTPEELLAKIALTFANVPKPKRITKSVAKACDDEWLVTERRRKLLYERDVENHWMEISDEEIENHVDIFPFLDGGGLLFYLPAFMCYSLKRYDTPHHTPTDFTVFACENPRDQFELFTDLQLQCVLDFLEGFSLNPCCTCAEDAAKAFDDVSYYAETRKSRSGEDTSR